MVKPIGECYDCGRKYGGLGWIDAIIPDEVWEIITPVPNIEGAGLLCINCIAKRCAQHNLHDVPVKLTSGPLKAD